MKALTTLSVLLLISFHTYSQNITNTLGTGGSFTIKDGSTTFLNLSQSDGILSLNNSFTLPVTTGSTLGVIFKGSNRFIHDYKPSGASGFNTFVGVNSGNFSMTASISYEASRNTSVGYSSLSSLTTGYQNSAFGYYSLYTNNTGRDNSAFGYQSLYYNTGVDNSAFGMQSLLNNSTGADNSAFGMQSLLNNTTGNANSAFGYESLYSNTTSSDNSAFGYQSLYYTTGDSNSAFGVYAGYDLTTGSNNTIIGFNARSSSNTVSNEITLGNSSVTTLRCQVTTITAISDARDKKNIRDLPLGLDFLMSVKPRLFNWDRREWYEDGKVDGSKMQEKPTAGFIAQELDEVQTTENAEWLNLVLKNNPEKWEATPGNLLPVIVKAIQELKEENDQLKAQLEDVKEIKEKLSEIEVLKEELNEQIRLLKTNNKDRDVNFSSFGN